MYMDWFFKLDASLVGQPLLSSITGISELRSGFLGSVLNLRHKKGVGKLVLEIEQHRVGATSSQLLTMGFSVLPPGILNVLLDMRH